jgi:hypothetical protein
MSRAALRPLLPAIAGVAGVLAWLFWFADPCLASNTFNNWSTRDAPVPGLTANSDVSGELVVVENPYWIERCHYWQGPANHVIGISTLLLMMCGIGWITSFNVRRRPRLAAAAIGILSVAIAMAIQLGLRAADLSLLGADSWLFMGFVLAVGAGVATLGASLARRWQARVASRSP